MQWKTLKCCYLNFYIFSPLLNNNYMYFKEISNVSIKIYNRKQVPVVDG